MSMVEEACEGQPNGGFLDVPARFLGERDLPYPPAQGGAL
jgi:hypothetical protein